MEELIVGIDLGTTNSEVAIVRDGKPVVFEEDGDPIIPSFVGVTEDGKLLVGKTARNQWVLAPERTIKSIKRKMGQDTRVRLGDQEYRPQEISAMILRALKQRASAQLGCEVTKAVITVPAYFNDAQRQATREAGELAGLEVVRIVNEPTAASLAYDPKQTELHRVLVYDLGGGTFDVSIVQSQEGVIEVLSSHGDTQLGGDDFDELLLQHLLTTFREQHDVDLSGNLQARARLLRAAEDAKKQLSFHAYAPVKEEFLASKEGQPLHLDIELARDDYEELIKPLLDRTMDSVQRALDDAKLTGAEIDQIILVGGSTRTPLVSRMLRQRLEQSAHQEVNPDLCVALGAAVQGALIAGQDIGAVLVDITPHSLGIKCLDYDMGPMYPFRFAPIVHRNTPLPATRSEVFTTTVDNQEAVNVEVYQGESDDVRQNHRIGNFVIEGLAEVPAGNELIVQLDMNMDGMLKVTARERATGRNKHITIDNALARFEREEGAQSQERLNQLWRRWEDETVSHDDPGFEPATPAAEAAMPELVPGPREGQRESVQARALIEKAERMLEGMNEQDRDEVGRLLNEIRAALTDRQWDTLSNKCDSLSDMLFYLEEV